MNKKIRYSIDTIRHSTSHLMAAAILELFPAAKFGIGPTIENGFYYDIDVKEKITSEDLKQITTTMKKMIKQKLPFEKKKLSIPQAIKLFNQTKQPYKIELLEDISKRGTTKITGKADKQEFVTIYKLGNFIDLCKGPHVKTTKDLGSFKISKIAGAYWRGSEKNKMLTRIYGIGFKTKDDLKKHITKLEQAAKRDHRKIGQALDLFQINENIGPGLVLWHPKGAILKKTIEDYILKEYMKNKYQLVSTPHIAKLNLWETSGHNDFYREDMFPVMHLKETDKEAKEDYQIKPMNCPFHIAIFQNQIRSYRDLPVRYTELGTVYRYEKSGVLHGITRVRGFTQDDAHIFCTKDQLDEEISKTISFALKLLKIFGFKEYKICLSTQPKKFVGSQPNWNKSIRALKKALKKQDIKFEIDKQGGSFYGPKIDIKIKDSIGREWQCTTIQVDFNLPQKFNICYIDDKGKKQEPIMIHRALLGSLERFIGILIEHYTGAFPVWLSPIQVYIAPVGKTHQKAASALAKELEAQDIKVQIDTLNETISYKIRKATKQKIPYILVIGDKETKGRFLNIRTRGGKIIKLTLKQFISKILKQIKNKTL
ncbi:threonine--tRNA ligase [Patescibacteria group bacterium]|nr:threonine--tRNA ligase [Patescibacteria group bacterium]